MAINLARPPTSQTPEPSQDKSSQQGLWHWMPLVLLIYVLVVGSYFVLRFGARWAEFDTTTQAQFIRSAAEGGSFLPSSGILYTQGYSYTAVSNLILAFTGLNVETLQSVLYPLISAALVFLALAFYREITPNRQAAALATLFLFIQPEFLFVIMRGSHERLLRALMLLALWLLVRSFRFRDRPVHFIWHVVLFYVAAYGIIATNSLFGMSFLFALMCTAGAAWLLAQHPFNFFSRSSGIAARLATVSLSIAALGFVFVFYIYPPASHSIQAMNNVGQKLAQLLLTTSPGESPYQQVVEAWTELGVYFLLSAEDYLLMSISVTVWTIWGVRWFIRPESRPELGVWLLWLLYGAFTLQGGLSILADRTGLLGSNLQHRSFPSFATIATPIVAIALSQLRLPTWGKVASGGLVAILAMLAVLKSTNEPFVSNKWTFYTPAELIAVRWADLHHRREPIWLGPDERLSVAYGIVYGFSPNDNIWLISVPEGGTPSLVISDAIRLLTARLKRPLPSAMTENAIYDSGTVQIFRTRARSPYQQ